MLLPLLLACGPDIRALYEEERKHALTVASTAPADWSPDLVVTLDDAALGRVVGAFLGAALADTKVPRLELPLGASATLSPRFTAKHVVLSPGKGCDSCLHFEAELGGSVGWSLGGLGGEFPAGVAAAGQLEVVVEGGTHVSLRPFKVGKVEFSAAGLGGLRASPASELQDFVRSALQDKLAPIPLGDLGASGLPIRLLRVRTDSGAVRIEALTDVPGALPARAGTSAADATISVSETAIAGLLRREAFKKGTVAMDVAVDPRAIVVEGTTFHLDLRLWRLVGSGWWRDYDTQGSLAVADGKVHLSPSGVTEVAASPGAALVDPLAALAQAQILEAITDNLARTLPAAEKTKIGGVTLRAVATSVRGAEHTLLVEADLRLPGVDR